MSVFTCCECGRQIIRFDEHGDDPLPEGEVPLCAACLMLPGWCYDPELRAHIDPEAKPCGSTETR